MSSKSRTAARAGAGETTGEEKRGRVAEVKARAGLYGSTSAGRCKERTPPVLDIPDVGTNQLIRHIKRGFDYRSLERFIEKTRLPKEDAINLVNISPRTMHRRKAAGRLSPEESDRLVRAARVVEQARQLFENDVNAANRWLGTPQPALAGATPLEYARTELGAREVEALIIRLEHGTFS